MNIMFNRTILILLIAILFFGLIANSTIAEAQSESTSSYTFNKQVDHITNNFEKLKEKITLFFKFDKKQKSAYQRELVEKRLAELDYVIKNKQWDYIEDVTSRYSTYLGNYINFVEKNKITGDKEQILNLLNGHKNFIEKMQTRFEFNSGWWILIEHDINVVKMSIEKIKAL